LRPLHGGGTVPLCSPASAKTPRRLQVSVVEPLGRAARSSTSTSAVLVRSRHEPSTRDIAHARVMAALPEDGGNGGSVVGEKVGSLVGAGSGIPKSPPVLGKLRAHGRIDCSSGIPASCEMGNVRPLRSTVSNPRFMTVPGIGPITALCFKATIDDPVRLKRSRSVVAYIKSNIQISHCVVVLWIEPIILKSGFVKVLRASRKSEIHSESGGQKKQDFCANFGGRGAKKARFFARPPRLMATSNPSISSSPWLRRIRGAAEWRIGYLVLLQE
jgi:hypothetical protein